MCIFTRNSEAAARVQWCAPPQFKNRLYNNVIIIVRYRTVCTHS